MKPNFISGATKRFLDLFFPPVCVSCGEILSYGADPYLCPECRKKWEKERCLRIKEVRSPKNDLLRILTVCDYDASKNSPSVGKAVLLRLKEEPLHYAADFIAAELVGTLSWLPFPLHNCIVTGAPRSRQGIRENGFDQVRLISECFARRIGAEYIPLLTNVGNIRQKELAYSGRFRNASRSYRFRGKYSDILYGADVILIDDVSTTGATLMSCAKILMEEGAGRVFGISFAGTVM